MTASPATLSNEERARELLDPCPRPNGVECVGCEEQLRRVTAALAEAERRGREDAEERRDRDRWPTCTVCEKPSTVWSCGSYCDLCVPSAVRARLAATQASSSAGGR